MLPQYLNVDMARACRNLIVTVEEIVDTEVIKQSPQLTLIPAFRTAAVCLVPHGSHPTATVACTEEDGNHFETYVAASDSSEHFDAYLDEYIRGTKDFSAYLEKIGKAHLKELEVAAHV